MPIIGGGFPPIPLLDGLRVECAFATTPDDPNPVWTDISGFVDLNRGINITAGRLDEFATAQAGSARVNLDNTDGRFTPGKTAGVYYPNVRIRKKLRVLYQDGPSGQIRYRHTGYVEEWPVEWPTGGETYATADVTTSDRFKRLSTTMRSVVEEEILVDDPTAYYTLGESAGSTTAGDTSGNGGGPLTTRQWGTGGTLTFGAATGPPTDGLTAASFAWANNMNGKYLKGEFVRPNPDQGLRGFGMEAFILTSATAVQYPLVVKGPGGTCSLSYDAAGLIYFLSDAAGTYINTTLAFNNGITHHVAVRESYNAATLDLTIKLYVDGSLKATLVQPGCAGADYGSTVVVGADELDFVFNGSISHVAVYDHDPTEARILAHNTSGTTAFHGERSDQRIARLASYGGIPVAEQVLDVGSSTSIPFVDTTGKNVLAAMQDVTSTENGVLIMDPQGRLDFQSRAARYNAASTLTITAPDIDPDSIRFVSNDALLINDVTATREGGITYRAVNAASVTDYGTSQGTLDLLTTSDNEVVDAANWRANHASSVTPRLASLTIDLLTSPALTDAALQIVVGQRITVSGLPSQAPGTSLDLFVEGWTEDISYAGWFLRLNTSTADVSTVWVLDSPTYSVLGSSTVPAY